ncbi:MAG: hypothetical protein MZU84_03520 [Sphingobacterium sp.]|nr:hypothetical protein [Sphingobacterium sp.]
MTLEEKRGFFRLITLKYQTTTLKLKVIFLLLGILQLLKKLKNKKKLLWQRLPHDLKTPIRSEILALELLLKGRFGELNEAQSDIVRDTLYSSKYMFSMVDNLLSTYRYENGSIILKKDSTDINELIKRCYIELQYLIDVKSQQVNS